MKAAELIKIDSNVPTGKRHTIDYGAILHTVSGYARLRINFHEWEIVENSVIVFFPGDVVTWLETSEDFGCEVLRYSSDILRKASLNVEHAVYTMLRDDRLCTHRVLIDEVVTSMFAMLRFYFRDQRQDIVDRIVTHQLQSFFIGFYGFQLQHSSTSELKKVTQRSEELFSQFMELLETEYKQGHEVAYYAEKMNITRKYLGIIVKDKTGASPKQLIDEFIIMRLQLSLQQQDRSLKQIADEFNFSDQSALTRYFKRYTGITPQKYRLL